MKQRTRLTLAITVVALVAGLVGACADGRPDAATADTTANGAVGAACTVPSEGCPCDEGAQTVCSHKVTGDDNFIFCSEGTRSCTGGKWGTCDTGATSLISTASLSVRAYGASSTCANADGGAIDPCDPYCNVFIDNAVGVDAGNGFTTRDGGIQVKGCGDGVKSGAEECDDGNLASGDGCSSACLLELGWQCPIAGAACSSTTCGNGIREGQEQCDDGNLRPYDGCSPTCQKEAVCPNGVCTDVCGDGFKVDSEQCDDGNVANGDGCSSTCTIEANASCSVVKADLPASITVPTILRDFVSWPTTGANAVYKHQDFENYNCGLKTGLVNATLTSGVPTLKAAQGCITSATTFNQWYRDDATVNKTSFDSLTLPKQADNSYLFSSTAYFPLDNKGFGNYAATGHNFSFTSELHYPFTYRAASGGTLNFTGDDDVWVFIAGKLVVDIGGVHSASNGSVTLNTATAATLGLVDGKNYEIDVFQAERHTSGSNYKLTLSGFEQARSFCVLPSDRTIVRDYQAQCTAGSTPVWQMFRWRASVPSGAINMRAATADTLAALPTVAGAAPVTVAIGSATPTNSPTSAAPLWVSETSGAPATPVPVATHLKADANLLSKQYLRVFITFAPTGLSPVLYDWQQLYDCIPNE